MLPPSDMGAASFADLSTVACAASLADTASQLVQHGSPARAPTLAVVTRKRCSPLEVAASCRKHLVQQTPTFQQTLLLIDKSVLFYCQADAVALPYSVAPAQLS